MVLLDHAKAGTPPKDYSERVKVMEGYMTAELSALERSLPEKPPQPTSRDLSAAALVYTMRDHHLDKARQTLEYLFALQEMNPGSSGYGTVPWQQNHPENKDPNAIEFTSESLGPLFLRYGSNFAPDFQSAAARHLAAAVAAIRRHEVPVSYTNIFLMKFTNLILIGEYLHDQQTLDAGTALLDQWIQFARANGVSEFGSAGYGAVQYNVISTLYNNVQDPLIAAKAKSILDYLAVDFAANYFGPKAELSGPSSRTYSFLGHDNGVNALYYLFGLQQTPAQVYPLDEAVMTWANATWGKYFPEPTILNLAQLRERVVRERWGLKPGQERYNYITPGYALGSSSAFYGPQDREISLQLSSTKRLPVITVVPDSFDSPFGKVQRPDKITRGGKPVHLPYGLSTTQEKGALLALLDLSTGLPEPTAADDAMSSVATNVILPLRADGLFIDGKPVAWMSDSIPVSEQTTIGVLEGKVGVAVRLFHADALQQGSSAFFFLKEDGKDLTDVNDFRDFPSARLVAYHFQGPGKSAPWAKNVRAGVLILAGPCATPEALQNFLAEAKRWTFAEKSEGGLWQVTASPPPGSDSRPVLMASLDLSTRTSGPRTVNGKEILPSLLTINGEDWANKIWQALNLPPIASASIH